jgi:hypothetical protein
LFQDVLSIFFGPWTICPLCFVHRHLIHLFMSTTISPFCLAFSYFFLSTDISSTIFHSMPIVLISHRLCLCPWGGGVRKEWTVVVYCSMVLNYAVDSEQIKIMLGLEILGTRSPWCLEILLWQPIFFWVIMFSFVCLCCFENPSSKIIAAQNCSSLAVNNLDTKVFV